MFFSLSDKYLVYMKNLMVLLLIILFCMSCIEEYKVPKEIDLIKMNLNVNRFDQDFFKTNSQNISELVKKYPYMAPRNSVNVDSLWMTQKKDTLLMEMLKEVNLAFPDFDSETLDIALLFKHIKYYFPEFTAPDLVTITSGVAYREKVELHNNRLFIFTDTIRIILYVYHIISSCA